MLQASEIPYVVLEMNPRTVRRAAAEGIPIFYGDAVSEMVLERLGVAAARRLNPQVYVIARTRYEFEIDPLYKAGADTVIIEEFETSLTIIRRVMDRLGVHPTRIDHAILEIRQKHYEPFLKSEVRGIEANEAIRMFEGTVRAMADGQTIEREGALTTNSGPDPVLRTGDRVHLIGSEQEVGRAMTLF